MICAPLKKSPNWASQSTRCWGLSTLKPYSNPSTASSLSGLLATCNKWVYEPCLHILQLVIAKIYPKYMSEPWPCRVWQSYICMAELWPKYGTAMWMAQLCEWHSYVNGTAICEWHSYVNGTAICEWHSYVNGTVMWMAQLWQSILHSRSVATAVGHPFATALPYSAVLWCFRLELHAIHMQF